MAWFKKERKPRTSERVKLEIPADAWEKCDECGHIDIKDRFVRGLNVCPQLGHTFSPRTNRSLMSMCPHSSHFSQASAGISSLTRSDVRGLRSFLNQAIRTTVGDLKATIWEGPPPSASPDRVTRCQSSA